MTSPANNPNPPIFSNNHIDGFPYVFTTPYSEPSPKQSRKVSWGRNLVNMPQVPLPLTASYSGTSHQRKNNLKGTHSHKQVPTIIKTGNATLKPSPSNSNEKTEDLRMKISNLITSE